MSPSTQLSKLLVSHELEQIFNRYQRNCYLKKISDKQTFKADKHTNRVLRMQFFVFIKPKFMNCQVLFLHKFYCFYKKKTFCYCLDDLGLIKHFFCEYSNKPMNHHSNIWLFRGNAKNLFEICLKFSRRRISYRLVCLQKNWNVKLYSQNLIASGLD